MNWFFPVSTYGRSLAWKVTKRWVRQSFPSVPTVSTAQLAQWLEADSSSHPVLIDARKLEEYAVSHLPNAYRAKTVAEVESLALSKNTPIVVYCSIGYRSGRLAQALRAVGYRAINLEGSIFQWANEKRALATDEKESKEQKKEEQIDQNKQVTHKVHPYNSFWGLLLNSSREPF